MLMSNLRSMCGTCTAQPTNNNRPRGSGGSGVDIRHLCLHFRACIDDSGHYQRNVHVGREDRSCRCSARLFVNLCTGLQAVGKRTLTMQLSPRLNIIVSSYIFFPCSILSGDIECASMGCRCERSCERCPPKSTYASVRIAY